MTTRRELLAQTAGMIAGLGFTGCGLMRTASAQGQPARRREVVVNGKRSKTVDIHAHCHIPEARELMGQKVRFPGLAIRAERINFMGEQCLGVGAASITPSS